MASRFLGAFAMTAMSVALALPGRASAGTNLVQNGDFSQNGGVGELAGNITYATDWTVGSAVDGSSNPFAFIVDSNADSKGFKSVYSTGNRDNITIWGPNSGTYNDSTNPNNTGTPPAVNNGWNGIPSPYTYALGDDGAYAAAPVSQDINGLTIGHTYTLSFQWAASQFYGFTGATTQNWQVSFGSDTVKTATYDLPSEGFSGWMTYTHTFTASSASQTLSFLSQGSPGVPPFLLLTGVSLEDTTSGGGGGGGGGGAVPEPGTLSLLAFGVIGVTTVAVRRRRRATAA